MRRVWMRDFACGAGEVSVDGEARGGWFGGSGRGVLLGCSGGVFLLLWISREGDGEGCLMGPWVGFGGYGGTGVVGVERWGVVRSVGCDVSSVCVLCGWGDRGGRDLGQCAASVLSVGEAMEERASERASPTT